MIHAQQPRPLHADHSDEIVQANQIKAPFQGHSIRCGALTTGFDVSEAKLKVRATPKFKWPMCLASVLAALSDTTEVNQSSPPGA